MFSTIPPSLQVQYSRAALLSLGSSRQALLPPAGWDKLAPSLPSAVLPKIPVMEKGDLGISQGHDRSVKGAWSMVTRSKLLPMLNFF